MSDDYRDWLAAITGHEADTVLDILERLDATADTRLSLYVREAYESMCDLAECDHHARGEYEEERRAWQREAAQDANSFFHSEQAW